MRSETPQIARARLHGGGEIAFLDLREAGQFGEGHPLFAVPAPYSRLESIVGGLVPRRTVPILLIDAGDGVAERAGERLRALGYADVAAVQGGVLGWRAAGFPLYRGVNVPSKVLGELAEAIWHPRTVTAEELAAARERGEALALFDTRPPEEYAKMRVPGAVCLPNGELAHRLDALPDDRPLVVTCAGRTRGIVGAIGLALIGAGDRVRALENGTQGWALAGFALDRGNMPEPFPALSEDGRARSAARADGLLRRFPLPTAAAADIAAGLTDPDRTTYVFDVRSAEEAAADPVAVAVPALGVQIVQATDQWVGVRRARIVLCCDTGLRAGLAAFWLRQLGYEVAVARIDDAVRALPARSGPRPAPDALPVLDAGAALERLRAGARLIDLRPSRAFRAGHVVGALWGIRPRLPDLIARLGTGGEVLLVAADVDTARLAARDLRDGGVRTLHLVEGGHAALAAAGAPTETTPEGPSDAEAIDFLLFVHDRHDGNLEASRRYLAWETGLVAQLDAAERAEYRLFGPTG